MNAMREDVFYMSLALAEAGKAAAAGEVPTGCVIVDGNGEIAAARHNRTESNNDACAHAEMLALKAAFERNGNWRLADHVLFVTKEPCPMCAGAIILSRVKRVVWGVSDPKRGGGSVFGIFEHPGINHHPEIAMNVLEAPCREILQDFFRRRRQK